VNRAIAWFAENSVAANLLMALIIGGGLLTISTLTMEVFPEIETDIISVSVLYPGAAPEEVEEAVCVRIEEAIQGLEGVKRITSTASESRGSVNVELVLGADVARTLDDVKSAVDAIDTFPEDVEEPEVKEVIIRRQVVNVALSGQADEVTLKVLGQQVRDEIAAIPGITQVDLTSVRPYEIAIEVSEADLRRYSLTFDEVARAVRLSSLDLPGGSIRTAGGEILLRTKGQAYRRPDFESIVLRSRPDGTPLTVGDVARVVDGFAETDQTARFDGSPTALIQVYRIGDQNAIEIASKVKAYTSETQTRMPEGITLTIWADFSRILESRLDLLLRNARTGFVLVFLILTLFLRFRLAFWVSLGIPISFLGAIWLMPTMQASVNLISLFAFIVVLGIVVDDAIIVGENIYTKFQKGERGLRAAIAGAHQVFIPVTFAVLTSIAAFSPLLTVPGTMGKIMRLIPEIVIATLVFSLIESLFILPAHLAHSSLIREESEPTGLRARWHEFQDRFASGLMAFVDRVYRPSLALALRWRYLAIAWGLASLLFAIGLVGGGWIKFYFMANVDADNVIALLTMPQGTSVDVTADAIGRIERAALELREELEREGEKPVVRHLLASVGDQPYVSTNRHFGGAPPDVSAAHLGEVNLELAPSEDRRISSAEIARRWREKTGPIPDAVELAFTSSLFSAGEPVNVQLAGPDYDELKAVAGKLKSRLAGYPGVTDIADSFRPGKQEIKLEISDEGLASGLTQFDVGRQVRQAFYGEEAQRIQRGRDDVRVMVRYPAEERRSVGDLEAMRIRTPDGREIPFSVAARAELGRGYASARRADRQRIVNVTADVDQEVTSPNEVLDDLTSNALPAILADHRSVRYSLEGEQREQQEVLGGLKRSMGVALLVIYALLAIPFRSYLQPLIIMSAIPFGFVGAVCGHLIMGMDLTILSMFGLVALTGIVVNDSLVMVDFINRERASGQPLYTAIREAGVARFRPILLTSLTTFAGLSPLILERSLQAQFLIPMAISLGFGVIFATFITLILVPVNYAILEDFTGWGARLLGRSTEEQSPDIHRAA
jgi:multidrug efflux pump subunit AcrB